MHTCSSWATVAFAAASAAIAQAPSVPLLSPVAPIVTEGNSLGYTLTSQPNAPLFLGLSFAQAAVPLPLPYGVLGLPQDATLLFGLLDGLGSYSYSLFIPTGYSGLTLYAQALVLDPLFPAGAQLSTNGLGGLTSAVAIASAGSITTSGVITFQDPVYVPGTGYPGTTVNTPVRFADLELVNANTLAVMQTGASNNAGAYSFNHAPQADPVFVRVKASTNNSQALYRIRVRMAPAGGATPTATEPIWSRSSANFAGNASNSSANFTIPVDPGTSQTANFDSAPFNILEIMQRVQDGVRTQLGVLAQVSAYVTPNEGTLGAFYGGVAGGEHYLFLSGGAAGAAASSDSDFYDDGVIGHEFGHFLEHVTFGSSSYGGTHWFGQRTIPSLAYGEGFGTWIGGVAQGNPLYADGGGFGANSVVGFTINLESDPSHTGLPHQANGPHGIYDEVVVLETLWDLIDGAPGQPADTDGDGIALNIGQVFAAMSTFTDNDSIYLLRLLSKLDSANGGPLATAQLASLATSPEATGWTYPPVGSDNWPTPLVVGAAATAGSLDATSTGTTGAYPSGDEWFNTADGNRLFRFTATQTTHTITLTHTSPAGGAVPNDLDLATLNARGPYTNTMVSGGAGINAHVITHSGLTVGNSYVVWVRGWTAPGDPTQLFAFGSLVAAQATGFTVRVQ
jgi:hypothetical protein